MTDDRLTAADLARWAALAEAAMPGAWAVEASLGDRWVHGPAGDIVAAWTNAYPDGAIPLSPDDAAFIAASREAVPALVATLREQAALVVRAGDYRFPGSCPYCYGRRGITGVTHKDDCPSHDARALLGDA